MAAETQYTAKTGMVKISAANTSLTGSGTVGTDIYTVITGASNGTLIKNVIIKATGTGATSTTLGMVRLFVYDGSNTRLLTEVLVPAMGQSSTDRTFEAVLPLNFKLKSGHVLRATTQNAQAFNVIAEGLDFAYYASSVRPESTNYTANTGVAAITAQNAVLTGAGTNGTDRFILVTAGATGANMKGLAINSISLKAYTDVTRGMLRLYIQNTGIATADTFLFTEVPVYPMDASATVQSYHETIYFENTLQIQYGFKIIAMLDTAASQSIAAVVDAMDWQYPA